MTRQKSENCVVPQSRRKPEVTRGTRGPEGGKAVPVSKRPSQLGLHFETAEESARVETDGGLARPRGLAKPYAEPKSKGKEKQVVGATLEAVSEGLMCVVTIKLISAAPQRTTWVCSCFIIFLSCW